MIKKTNARPISFKSKNKKMIVANKTNLPESIWKKRKLSLYSLKKLFSLIRSMILSSAKRLKKVFLL